ncbi:MAG: TRAP transporter small permease [Rhodobacteraceae bacterium]|nr:TRAP transporter small permease [Paracoccaceae bacterium]
MAIAKQAQVRLGHWLTTATKWLAYAGGAVLVAIAVMTVVSIIGRAFVGFGLKPIKGDFEMVEAGCAIAIFAFLPWCQIKRGHVTVDIFISRLPERIKALLGLIGDTLLAVASYVILWRLWLGFGEKFPYGGEGFRKALGMGSKPFFVETTYELEIPIWMPYGAALVGAAMFFVAASYSVWRALNWVIDGREEML